MKKFFLPLSLTLLLVAGIVMLVRDKPRSTIASGEQISNVRVENGRQIIEIMAKGGYLPRTTAVQAGMPTELRVKTNGTYDCSTALTIPSIRYRTFLPASGETVIDLGVQQPGTTVKGVCSMGMYSFAIYFK